MDKVYTIISIGLAIAAIVSPICVSFINNCYAKQLRIEELKHDEELKKIDANLRLSEKRLDIEFNAKKDAFSKLYKCAGDYYVDMDNAELLSLLCTSAYEAAALCSTYESISTLTHFALFAIQDFDSSDKNKNFEHFRSRLSDLSYIFAYELYGNNLSRRDDQHC